MNPSLRARLLLALPAVLALGACVGPQPLGVEELCVRSGLPTASLLSTLMKLQLTGRVTCLPGKRYVLR